MHSPTEAIVGTIWAELLQHDGVNPQDNFFEMGCDSLMIMMMLFRIKDVLGMQLSPGTIMDAPTLREFCRVIDSHEADTSLAPDRETGGVRVTEGGVAASCARKDFLPVSFIQEQVIGAELMGRYDPEKTKSYCLDLCYRIKGGIDIPALDKALCEVVRRHEILRTGYSVADRTICQNVNDAPESILRVEDLRSLSQDDRERETARILKAIAEESFSYFRDQLMLSATLIVGETEHVLVVLVSHVAADGVSMMIMQRELFLLYDAFSRQAPSPLADLPIQYADVAAWERDHFSGERLESRLVFWRKLAQQSLNTLLPLDRLPSGLSYAGDRIPITIGPELATHLRQLGRMHSVTLFTVLFAAFVSLIHAFSGYRYNFFCMPVANRPRGETRSAIGCFMNFQFIYVDLSGNPTFAELVGRLNRTLHDVYDNYVPFHFITQQIPPQGPVVEFQLLTSLEKGVQKAGNELSFVPFKLQKHEFALFPIDVRLSDSSEAITGYVVYQTAAYERNTMVELMSDYVALLTRVTHDPDIRLHDMGIEPHRNAVQED